MSEHASPRGTFLKVADAVKAPVANDPELTELPSAADLMRDIIADEGLEVGAAFPSASALATRFGVSRPTVTKALDNLEAAGVPASRGQGKVRTVRTAPVREKRPQLAGADGVGLSGLRIAAR
ncbi:GntR family transcriptional regulator [Streptomyces olivochromogenes]|uniref:HTH gntR-type domain-containing protein n=1 Tax=Streptomyces olivochromogenes TaxID=1963 RepID=A0A250V9Q5_STROL|nr:GntR family transcriptional regulator [Streptomyces olivochromogenes]KUN48483.1 hypothetical protein AQJ27_06910 [Streptomyces olivochromogenes]GAX50891.1 hypothetical protein SO3561_02390 [Streptomyces olivochromogenes]